MSPPLDALLALLKERLLRVAPRSVNLPGVMLREAAVLVPLVSRGGVPHLVFTQRPKTLRTHAGQISFPGGRRDPEDTTPLHTALREAEEEMGIPRADVQVLGMLDEIPTVTQYRVTPFVGVISSDLSYRPSPEEIDIIIEAPMAHLLDPANHRTDVREEYEYNGHIIWGATARILTNLLTLVRDDGR